MQEIQENTFEINFRNQLEFSEIYNYFVYKTNKNENLKSDWANKN